MKHIPEVWEKLQTFFLDFQTKPKCFKHGVLFLKCQQNMSHNFFLQVMHIHLAYCSITFSMFEGISVDRRGIGVNVFKRSFCRIYQVSLA